MRRAWLLVPGFVALAMMATGASESPPGTPPPLLRQDVLKVESPDVVHDNTTEPGESGVIPRWSEVAPPMIPHGIADFLPITRSDNACLDCHVVEEKVAGEPTPIPESHYRDLRNDPDTVMEVIAGSRYLCISCHEPLTAAGDFPPTTP